MGPCRGRLGWGLPFHADAGLGCGGTAKRIRVAIDRDTPRIQRWGWNGMLRARDTESITYGVRKTRRRRTQTFGYFTVTGFGWERDRDRGRRARTWRHLRKASC
jgi:hypothetical protein